jgi:hypothetical protein
MDIEIKPYEESSFKDEEVIVDEVSVSYLQNSDASGNDGKETVQKLKITARNNGIGRFLNIKTDSWSIDSVDELRKIIDDFKVRASMFDKEENIQENGN